MSAKKDDQVNIPHYLNVKDPENPQNEQERVKLIERMVFMSSQSMQDHANYQENKYKI